MPTHQNYFAFRLLVIVVFCFIAIQTNAQRDTVPQQITIITDFKPVIRSVAKINHTSTNITGDTTKTILPYKVPVQLLYYHYQPVTLKPVSLEKEELIQKGDRLMVKGGFGTFRSPLFQAATYLGDGESFLCNINADYISAKGKIINQDYSSLSVKSDGSYFFPNHELYAAVAFNRNQHYLYGYDHQLYNYAKTDVSRLTQEIGITVGLRNTTTNTLDIKYDPSFHLSLFKLSGTLRENNFTLRVPVEKMINEKLYLRLNAVADLTGYTTLNFVPNNIALKNNLIAITPELHYHVNKLKLHGGVHYFNNNGSSFFLPNISAEFSLSKDNLIFQAGWIGDVQKNNFTSLNSLNPYMKYINNMNNTRQTEIYGGLKMSLIKHVLFTAKASYVRYNDFQFFINDTTSDQLMKQFLVVNENTMNNFRIHGDISYIIRDRFNLTGGVTINGFTGLTNNEKPWHLLPIEINADMKWRLVERLLLKSHFYLFAGGHYLDIDKTSKSLGGGADISAGLEFKINSHFAAFTDLNNIFGRNYQRWHNYPVYGFNAMLGIIARF